MLINLLFVLYCVVNDIQYCIDFVKIQIYCWIDEMFVLFDWYDLCVCFVKMLLICNYLLLLVFDVNEIECFLCDVMVCEYMKCFQVLLFDNEVCFE